MKRVAEEPVFNAKRQKTNPFPADGTSIFEDPAQEKDANDLLHWTTGESGFISGKVHMKWPPVGGKYRIVLEIFSLSVGAKQFEVHFTGCCASMFRSKGFQFQVAQQLRLSLRAVDCKIKKQGNVTGESKSLPVILHYDEGVALEVSSNGQTPSCKIDTWFKAPTQSEPEPKAAKDDWFSTPKEIAPPVLAITKGDLMDVDEEPLSATPVKVIEERPRPPQPIIAATSSVPSRVLQGVASPSIDKKNLRSQLSSDPPKRPPPLHNIGNYLATMPPPRPSEPPASISAPSLHRSLHPVTPTAANNATIPASQGNPQSHLPPLHNVESATIPPPRPPQAPVSAPPIHRPLCPIPPVTVNNAPISTQQGNPQNRHSLVNNIGSVTMPPTLAPVSAPPNHRTVLPAAPSTTNPVRFPPPAGNPRSIGESVSPPSNVHQNIDTKHTSTLISVSRAPAAQTIVQSYVEPAPQPAAMAALTKKQRKNRDRYEKRKEKKARDAAAAAAKPSDPASTTPVLPKPDPAIVPSDSISSAVLAPTSIVLAPASVAESNHPLPPSNLLTSAPVAEARRPPSPPVEQTTAMRVPLPIPNTFCSIAKFRTKGHGILCNVIGVITSISPPRKTIKDWTCTLRVVDPTYYDGPRPSSKEGLAVNLFHPLEKELPVAKPGDVIVLPKIKTSLFNNDITGVGFKERLLWAVYANDSLVVPEHGPDSFYTPEKDELAYCSDLAGWWREVSEQRKAAMGTVHQVGGSTGTSVGVTAPSRRQHMLLSQVDCDKYFDCTVEVYCGHPSGQLHSIYVTDYTTIPKGKRFGEAWCPQALESSMLRIEMWDAASQEGPKMKPGDLYFLGNVRMQEYGGHLQAKLVETKIHKLQASDAEDNPHLKALLERKQTYGQLDADHELKLIGQGQNREFLACVVELLHVDEPAGAIYISDYTKHAQIPPINEPWARGLDGYVLKVMIGSEHNNILRSLEVGRYYRIQNLRLEASVTANEFRSRLAGSGRIDLVNLNSTVLDDWKEQVIERKTNLKRPVEPQAPTPPADISQPDVVVPLSSDGRTFSSIKQVLSSTQCPSKFLVRARVVDFFPMRLVQSFRRVCSNCNRLISDTHVSCVECDDVEHQYVTIVCVLRLLIDDGNDQLKVSVSGDVPLLKGIEPVMLDNTEAARRFSERMKPLIDHLVDADGLSRKEPIEPSGQLLTLVVDSWKRKTGEIVHGLRGYEAC